MRGMNPLRRFLLRNSVVSRITFLAALAVLLARALLPGAVMLDPESSAQGDFALVLCSGHGPMFAHDSMSDANMMHDHMDMSGAPAHDSMTGDDGICPFSAALFVACVGIALAVLLFALKRITCSWRVRPARPLLRPSPHFRPLSRAPPLFS
jgi:hypothetical protein